MIIKKEELKRFSDKKVRRPLYAHQKFVLNYEEENQLKIHVPTSGGKTLSAVLFALKEKFKSQNKLVKTIITYPTNLLSQNQFEESLVKGLTDWIGAKEKIRGILHPVTRKIEPGWSTFLGTYGGGAPTIVFELPANLGKSNLYLTILNGEILFNMFDEENRVELGDKKGNYLKNILSTLDNRDHILITSPDLLGYVAQQCYVFPNTWYRSRWKNDLSLLFWGHKIVVDEYHFYDPYTYINLENTLERLNIEKILLLSATKKEKYFTNAKNISIDELENEFGKNCIGTHVASYPIEVNLVEDEIHIDENPKLETIYFFNSVVAAHQIAEGLRNKGVELTEWTGIQKSNEDKLHKLIIATSAAEVGLDLELYNMHTQFWGFDWEVPSLIQRIGRIGRFKSEKPFKAYIHIEGTQAKLLKTIFDKNDYLTKEKFTDALYETYGVPSFVPENYVSSYLWNEEKRQELKMMWQVINDKVSFYFRPPQSQAIFDWNGHKFLYNKFVIENQYHIDLIKKVTDMPFWRSFGLSEYEILQKKSNEERSWKRPYDGTLKPYDKSKKWFVYSKQNEKSDNII